MHWLDPLLPVLALLLAEACHRSPLIDDDNTDNIAVDTQRSATLARVTALRARL